MESQRERERETPLEKSCASKRVNLLYPHANLSIQYVRCARHKRLKRCCHRHLILRSRINGRLPFGDALVHFVRRSRRPARKHTQTHIIPNDKRIYHRYLFAIPKNTSTTNKMLAYYWSVCLSACCKLPQVIKTQPTNRQETKNPKCS